MIDAIIKLLEKLKVTFNMSPSTLVLILTLITSSVYFYVDNKNLKEKVPQIEEENNTLKKKVTSLEGRIQTYDKIMEAFIENPPAVLKNEIARVEIQMKKFHNNTAVAVPDTIIPQPASLPTAVIDHN